MSSGKACKHYLCLLLYISKHCGQCYIMHPMLERERGVNPWGIVAEQEVCVSYQNYVILCGEGLWKTGGGNIELAFERIMTA